MRMFTVIMWLLAALVLVESKRYSNPTIDLQHTQYQTRDKDVFLQIIDSKHRAPVKTLYVSKEYSDLISVILAGDTYKCSHINGQCEAVKAPQILQEEKRRQERIGVEAGDVVTFNLNLASSDTKTPPIVSVLWSRDKNPVQSNHNHIQAFQQQPMTSNGQNFKLRISHVQNDDFGRYEAQAANKAGVSTFAFVLQHVQKPQVPLFFEILSVGENTVQVQWRSGFHGAISQKFFLYVDMTNLKRTIEHTIQDTWEGELIRSTFTHLYSNTEYKIHVRAKNNKHLYSDFTPTLRFKTEKSPRIRSEDKHSRDSFSISSATRFGKPLPLCFIFSLLVVFSLLHWHDNKLFRIVPTCSNIKQRIERKIKEKTGYVTAQISTETKKKSPVFIDYVE